MAHAPVAQALPRANPDRVRFRRHQQKSKITESNSITTTRSIGVRTFVLSLPLPMPGASNYDRARPSTHRTESSCVSIAFGGIRSRSGGLASRDPEYQEEEDQRPSWSKVQFLQVGWQQGSRLKTLPRKSPVNDHSQPPQHGCSLGKRARVSSFSRCLVLDGCRLTGSGCLLLISVPYPQYSSQSILPQRQKSHLPHLPHVGAGGAC